MRNKSHRKPNKLSWSNTRITLLEYCEKKYFLNYYTFALKKTSTDLWKTTLILKKLKSLEMRMGEKTHYLISDYLHLVKKGEDSDENIEILKENLAEEMRLEFNLSKYKNYEELNFDDKWGLSEHYYKENIDDQLEPTIQKVLKNLEALISSPLLTKIIPLIKNNPQAYIESPRTPNFDAMKVAIHKIPNLKDINIMASPDFWTFNHWEQYFILDRKSGKEPINQIWITDQLKVYALKILLKKGTIQLLLTKIDCQEIYLPSLQSYGGTITQEDIDNIILKITQDVNFQKQFLVNQDPIANQPLESNFFSRTSSEKKCEHCTFRKACQMLKNFE